MYAVVLININGILCTYLQNSKWWDVEADENGIVSGHSYTITDVQVIQMTNGQYVQLLRIRNPWANDTEWNGDWSDL